ncbi:hypothetical protein SNEBB_000612 [Seison nebaliae]|nr:hypothetical protein SNEBB_000612 [Seison nebaliae]
MLHTNDKMQILNDCQFKFSAEQTSHVLSTFKHTDDQLNALEIIKGKLNMITCQEARHIISSFPFANDQLSALNLIKQLIVDLTSRQGVDYILSVFVSQESKLKAFHLIKIPLEMEVLNIAAGAHISYTPLGGIQTQANPLTVHQYGSLDKQLEK